MLRILFLTSRLPFPPYRGDKLKIWNLLRRVAESHEVALLSFIQDSTEAGFAGELERYCKRVELLPMPAWESVLECLKALPSRDPFQIAYFRNRAMTERLGMLVREWHPDVIHTHLIRMAPYTAVLQDIPRVLDMTDSVSLYLRRFLETERNPLKRMLLSWEYARMMRFEPIVARFERALVCSDIDRAALLRNVPSASIDLLYNGVDTDVFRRHDNDRTDPFRIIFTGNMSYFPNIDGARYLVEEIFPCVRDAVPQATLYIVGQNPPRSVRTLAREGIVVTGFVKDIRLEYARSAIAVSPIRFGAGTLNKILEPLAMGVPVVATSYGVTGLNLSRGAEILVADDTQGFANHVIRLLRDSALRQSIGSAATLRIRQQFNWGAIGASLLAVYADVTDRQRASSFKSVQGT